MSRVALIGENSIGYVDTLIDIWNNMDCAVLLDWRIPFSTAIEMMIEADVHTCFIEKGIFNKLENEIPDSIDFVTYEKQNSSAALLPSYIYEKFHENYSRSEAVVIYSSGTTGKSKGIILSHYAINTNADAITDYMKLTVSDCFYIAKTISHSSTITGELLVALKSKISLVIAPTIVPPRYILNNISKYNVTLLCLNPTLLSFISEEYKNISYDINSLRNIYVSGSILNEQIYIKAHEAFGNIPVYNVYGLSEAGPRVCAQTFECCKSNSVGKPLKNVEIVITDEKGKLMSSYEYGIIHINTNSIFSGYISGEKKHKSLYKDWLNSGDIGYTDKFGELHIAGRIDDMIVLNSHKIYPGEIEEKILSMSTAFECVVVKIEYKDKVFLGCLYVGDEELNVRESLNKVLVSYEIPSYFFRCEALPRNLNGKVSRTMAKTQIITLIENSLMNDK